MNIGGWDFIFVEIYFGLKKFLYKFRIFIIYVWKFSFYI